VRNTTRLGNRGRHGLKSHAGIGKAAVVISASKCISGGVENTLNFWDFGEARVPKLPGQIILGRTRAFNDRLYRRKFVTEQTIAI
jgi:hypothetical protein